MSADSKTPRKRGRKPAPAKEIREAMERNAGIFRDQACDLFGNYAHSAWKTCTIYGFAVAPTNEPGLYRGRLFCRVKKDSSLGPRLAASLWAERCVDAMLRRDRVCPSIAVDKKTFAVSRKSSVDGTVEVSFMWNYAENGIPK